MPQFKLPDPGEGLVEADIVTWKVKAGDEVKVNDIVVEVETAKSLVELPIPWAGTVTELLVAEGDTVEVGDPIIVIDTGDGTDNADSGGGSTTAEQVSDDDQGDDLVPDASDADSGTTPKREAVLVGYGAAAGATTRRARKKSGAQGEAAVESKPEVKALAKPPVRKYAKDKGVDIGQVTPTRADGVISRADIDAHLSGGAQSTGIEAPAAPSTEPAASAGAPQYTPPTFDRSADRETRTPVKGVRKMTAKAMSESAFTAPHVTEFITIDATGTIELVERLKSDREFRDLKVSPLLILAKAVTIAVRRNPGINAVWESGDGSEGDTIVQRNYVNLGIAAATPRGLIVPNIKDADLMDLRQIAEALGDLVATARAGRTQPAQMSGGTITITNVGVFGVDTGTPLINPGESAIVAFGAIRRQPWVVTAADGTEEIVPRWVTQLALSFDHRLIDGELGSRFLADLAAIVEDPARALVWG